MADIKLVFEADTAPVDRAVRLLDNLEAELRDVQRAEKAGLITKQRLTSETARLNKNISTLKTVSAGSAKDFRKFEKSLYGSGKAARANEVAMQQAGYQLQDFIVQVQAGTSPLIAFSQQGSQLAGFFAGPWGAAIGLGIAALGGLGTALLGTSIKAKTLQQQMEELADAFDNYKSVVETNAIAQVNDQFGQTTSVLIQIQRELNNIAKIKAIESLNDSSEALRKQFEGFEGVLKNISDVFETRTFSKETARIRDGLLNFSNEAISLGQRLETALNIRDTLLANVGPYEEMNSAQREFYDSLLLVIQRMEQAKAIASPETSKRTGYEGEFEGAMEAMATQTTQQITDAFITLQRYQAGFARDEAARMQEAEAHNERMLGLQAAQQEVNKAIASEQKANQDQLYNNAMLQKQNAMANDITAEQERQRLADQTHSHMMALQKAFYDDAKVKAGEVASATYLANYKAVLAYQQMAETRMAAPDEPVKPSRTGPKPTTIEDTIKNLRRQINSEKILRDLTGQRRREEEAFLELKYKNQDVDIKTSEARLRNIAQEIAAVEERTRVVENARRQQEQLQSSIESSFEQAFMSIVDGTKSVQDAFKDMARQIIAELYRVMVVQRLVNSISGVIFPSANGNVFSGGSPVTAYANGGIVGSPTYFPMSGGRTGLMGEAGPEAIMPLKRGKNGKLGVQAEGGTGDVTIHQSFNFAANGDDSVKKIIAQEAPKIAQMTQQQILDSRRRGGQMKAVFG